MNIGSIIPFRRHDSHGRTGSLLLDRARQDRVSEARRVQASGDDLKVWSQGHFRAG